ncbi:hypothetical protein C8J57DRAFT_1528053 [Mycena rebaudengoi]|nr:hypothetical protein C8J57DRAFT_1528053 [Mycena rebaudengoi]
MSSACAQFTALLTTLDTHLLPVKGNLTANEGLSLTNDELVAQTGSGYNILCPSSNIPVQKKLRAITSILIPKGTTVYIAVGAANHNRCIWGDDALEFKPERWGNGNAPMPSATPDETNKYITQNFQDFENAEALCFGCNHTWLSHGLDRDTVALTNVRFIRGGAGHGKCGGFISLEYAAHLHVWSFVDRSRCRGTPKQFRGFHFHVNAAACLIVIFDCLPRRASAPRCSVYGPSSSSSLCCPTTS